MLFERIFREFDRRKIRYLVIDGIAVNLHGFARATGDLDIILSFQKNNLKKFVEMVKSLGFRPKVSVKIEEFADASKRQIWARKKHMKVFSVYNPKNEMEHIDIMTESYLDFERAYKSRELISAGNIKISLVSIADLIKLKRISARERDKIDIKALQKIKEIKDEKKKKIAR